MGPYYIYSYNKSHAYSRSDFGPAKAVGRSQTRPVFLSLNAEEFRYIVVMRKLDGT